MDNSCIDKKTAKKKSRDATIKHYILGYILECTVKNDMMITVNIRNLLVYDLKIMTLDTFTHCLQKAKINRMIGINGTKKSYKAFKSCINITEYDKEEQIKIVDKLQKYAKNYKNGIFVNSKMCESSYVDVKFEFKG